MHGLRASPELIALRNDVYLLEEARGTTDP
jgi:hypothetical protein